MLNASLNTTFPSFLPDLAITGVGAMPPRTVGRTELPIPRVGRVTKSSQNTRSRSTALDGDYTVLRFVSLTWAPPTASPEKLTILLCRLCVLKFISFTLNKFGKFV